MNQNHRNASPPRGSALLMVTVLLTAVVVGTLLGAFAARHLNRWQDNLISMLTVLAYATPVFLRRTNPNFEPGLWHLGKWSAPIGWIAVAHWARRALPDAAISVPNANPATSATSTATPSLPGRFICGMRMPGRAGSGCNTRRDATTLAREGA